MTNATKRKSKFRAAAVFGAAMSTALAAPEINAEIFEISWAGGLPFISFSPQGSTAGSGGQPADIDQVGGLGMADFDVFYTQFTNGPYGSNMFSNRGFGIANKSIVGVAQLQPGDVIQPSTFVGQTRAFGIVETGYAGFITNNGNVGWFKIQLDVGLAFSEGQFGSAAEALLVGDPLIFSDGILSINGVAADDVIRVTETGGGVTVDFNGFVQQFEDVQELNINTLAGSDQVVVDGFVGPITINGGDGNDTLTVNGPATNVTIYGEGGDDTILGGSGPDMIFGGLGDDDINGRGGADFLVGGDSVLNGPETNTIAGGNGADTILGSLGVDIVNGGDGADTILTFSSDDEIMGGRGNDQIEAGTGNDLVAAGAGSDTVAGGPGDDIVSGSGGQDMIDGGPGIDTISGGAASDTIQGGSGNDVIEGNDGLDMINGGPGDDEIFGGRAADTISGGAGNDVLNGQSENDVVNGNAGDDILTGGAGDDQLNGGNGVDTATDTGELGEVDIEIS